MTNQSIHGIDDLINLGNTYKYYRDHQPPKKFEQFVQRIKQQYGNNIVELIERQWNREKIEREQEMRWATIEQMEEQKEDKKYQALADMVKKGSKGKGNYRNFTYYGMDIPSQILEFVRSEPGLNHQQLQNRFSEKFGSQCPRRQFVSAIKKLDKQKLVIMVKRFSVMFFTPDTSEEDIQKHINALYVDSSKLTLDQSKIRKKTGRLPKDHYFSSIDINAEILGYLQEEELTIYAIIQKIIDKHGQSLSRDTIAKRLQAMKGRGIIGRYQSGINHIWYFR
jgi:hypothetical protein